MFHLACTLSYQSSFPKGWGQIELISSFSSRLGSKIKGVLALEIRLKVCGLDLDFINEWFDKGKKLLESV